MSKKRSDPQAKPAIFQPPSSGESDLLSTADSESFSESIGETQGYLRGLVNSSATVGPEGIPESLEESFQAAMESVAQSGFSASKPLKQREGQQSKEASPQLFHLVIIPCGDSVVCETFETVELLVKRLYVAIEVAILKDELALWQFLAFRGELLPFHGDMRRGAVAVKVDGQLVQPSLFVEEDSPALEVGRIVQSFVNAEPRVELTNVNLDTQDLGDMPLF